MKKELLTLVLCGLTTLKTTASEAQNSTTETQEQKNMVHVTKCSTLEFSLLIDQKDASAEERERALACVSEFLSTTLPSLKERLENEAPHVKISLTLLNAVVDEGETKTITEAPEA